MVRHLNTSDNILINCFKIQISAVSFWVHFFPVLDLRNKNIRFSHIVNLVTIEISIDYFSFIVYIIYTLLHVGCTFLQLQPTKPISP